MYVKLTVKMDAFTDADAQQLLRIKEDLYKAWVAPQDRLILALQGPSMDAATALTNLRLAGPQKPGQSMSLEFEAVGILRPQLVAQLSEGTRQPDELRDENEELKQQLAAEKQRADAQLDMYRLELKRLRRLARRRWRSHRR